MNNLWLISDNSCKRKKVIIRNRTTKETATRSSLNNRGYERSEYPRLTDNRGTCTLEEWPIIPRGRPRQGRCRCWLTSGGAAHTPVT